MIEALGFRHAAGKPTARAATAAAAVFALTYLVYGAEVVAIGLGVPGDVTFAAYLIMLILYMLAMFLFILTLVMLIDVDKQPVTQPAAIPDETTPRRWWRTSLEAAWLRQPAIWPVAGIVAAIDLASLGAPLGGLVHGAMEAAVLALMIWHLRAAARLARVMRHTAKLGSGQPYWGFDWNDADVSDDARFNERFRTQVWKPPHLITHPVEADKYAQRARSRRVFTMTAAAGTTLVSAVWAQRVVVKIWQDLTPLTGHSTPHDASLGNLLLWCGALVSFVIPILLQHRATELDALAKMYDERSTALRNEGREVFRAPNPELMSWAPAPAPAGAEVDVRAVERRPAERLLST